MGKKLTTEEFQARLDWYYDGKLKIVGEFNGFHALNTIKCMDCNYTREIKDSYELFRTRKTNHKKIGCPNCAKLNLFDTEDDFINKLKVKNTDVKYISGYTRSNENVNVECKKCGYHWSTRANNLINAISGCPDCNNQYSKVVIKIRYFLMENNINFKQEFWFEDLKSDNGYVLKFDFSIKDKYDNILFLVEYDGEQHFIPVELWGGEENLKNIQQRDNLKNKYCKENKIKLLRFSYKDNLEKIKRKIISQLKEN